jgi:D-alanyl-lipoteichoic acid acyltransferase DltB (MBOAT superfamily)
VYIPLGGNRKRVYLNVAIVFLLTGIWHGAAYTFIVWGLWHGLFNLTERLVRQYKKKRNIPEPTGLKAVAAAVLGHIYTLFVVIIGWVFFRAADLQTGIDYVKSMFGLGNDAAANYLTLAYYLDKWTLCALIWALVAATPLPKLALEKLRAKLPEAVCDIAGHIFWLGALMLCILQVASNTYSAFIYFQF